MANGSCPRQYHGAQVYVMKRSLERYLDILTQSDLFRGIEGDRLIPLLHRMRARVATYAKGETIYRCGDEMRETSVVLSGTVLVEASDDEGEDVNLTMVRQGEEFGAFMALSGSTRGFMRLYAGTRCTVVTFDLGAVGRNPTKSDEEWQLANNIMRNFAEKCAYLYQKVQIYGKKRIRSRLRLYFMTLDMADGELVLPMNRTMLAAYLGVDRTAMARELSRMQREGIIALDRRRVRILDPGFLQNAARQPDV